MGSAGFSLFEHIIFAVADWLFPNCARLTRALGSL